MILHLDDQRDHHVTRWRASGLSRAAYCREHGLAYHNFLSWTKQSAVPTRAEPSGFIEVLRPAVSTAEHASLATLTLPSGIILRVAAGMDADWIGRVIAAVRSC